MLSVNTNVNKPAQAYSPIEGTKGIYPPPPSLPNLDMSTRHTVDYDDGASTANSKNKTKRLSAPTPSPRLHFQSSSNEEADIMKIRIVWYDWGVSRYALVGGVCVCVCMCACKSVLVRDCAEGVVIKGAVRVNADDKLISLFHLEL